MRPFFPIRHMSSDAAVSGGVQLRSITSPWVRFTWQSSLIPDLSSSDSSGGIRLATKDESQKVIEVILTSLSMDSAWNDSFVKVEQHLKDSVTRLFGKEDPLCLVIPKGNRFIAASLIDPIGETFGQLLSGPIVLTEYHNRGIGSQLLHASLITLRDRDHSVISGVTRAGTTAARHVYNKFGGLGECFQFSFLPQGATEAKGLNPFKD